MKQLTFFIILIVSSYAIYIPVFPPPKHPSFSGGFICDAPKDISDKYNCNLSRNYDYSYGHYNCISNENQNINYVVVGDCNGGITSIDRVDETSANLLMDVIPKIIIFIFILIFVSMIFFR